MTLSFPNRSRSYDAPRSRVRFWGHDGAMEVAFFLNEDALFLIDPKLPKQEDEILRAFDTNRERITAAAQRAYTGHPTSAFTLTAKDI